MNVAELTNLSRAELNELLLQRRKEQFMLRLKRTGDERPQTHMFRQIRKQIARIKTIITQKVNTADGQ